MADRGLTIKQIYMDKRLLSFFRGYLASQRGTENWRLFTEIQEFKQLLRRKPEKILSRTTAWIIYQEYMQPDAAHEIPIPFATRKKVFEKISNGDINEDLFDEIEVETVLCLQTECIPKFVNSEWYQRYGNHESPEPELSESPGFVSMMKRNSTSPSLEKLAQGILVEQEVHELLTSVEEQYIYKLRFLMQYVRPEMREKVHMSDSDLEIFFGNLDELYILHETTQAEMLPDVTMIQVMRKAIFERRFVELYTRYIQNIPFAMMLMERLGKKSNRFNKYYTRHDTVVSGKFPGQTVKSLLFEIHFDLIHAYFNACKRLRSASSDDLSSSKVTQSVSSILGGLIKLREGVMSEMPRLRTLFNLRENIVGYPGNLAKFDRVYVKEGELEVQELEAGYAPFYFFLFNDKLVRTLRSGERFKFIDFLPLLDASIDQHGDRKFVIQSGLTEECLRAPNGDVMKEWIISLASVTNGWKKMQRNQALDKEKHLLNIARDLKKNIQVKDRGGVFKSYKDCFVGSDAIFYLIENSKNISSREEAEGVMNQLLRHELITSCTNEQVFKGSKSYYRFADKVQ
eukprot:CAMPEP_0119124218 /NCGR_PEP_ID=MMETSP1310-20130426/3908_1 /TAXON_ID=464262 /ORGANISM="Genus nov. species nov., Strain RCC2339" /LENGTH=570 /DNA_ID=CAMNT_0007114135 /DNA_START=123 /DNA_END=1835 /DNA_ORIENTATION=+